MSVRQVPPCFATTSSVKSFASHSHRRTADQSPMLPAVLHEEPKPKAKTRKSYTTTGASLKRMEALGLMAKKPSSKRALRGWGPYQSVVRERSVEFNLKLDLQHLRQEIDDMLVTRDLLTSRVLLQRHDPSGSLAQTMKAYYEVLRRGFVPPDRDPEAASQQQAFVQRVLADDIDIGDGFSGSDVMLEQGRTYARMFRVISLQLDQLHVVNAGDSVVILSKGRFRFQIQQQSILGIFPHVAGNQRILSRLIGQEAEVATRIAFYFDSTSKVIKCDADMDFASAFMMLLQDPQDVLDLLDHALIANNCMIGINTASENDARIEMLTEPVANFSHNQASITGGRSDHDHAKQTNGPSSDSFSQPQTSIPEAAKDETSKTMSIAFILG